MSANPIAGELVATPSAGTAMQTGMGRGISASGDTAVAAVSAQQTALVQAAYLMADRRPRDWDKIRVNLLAACKRPLFAKAARYKKPVGMQKDEATGRWEQKFAEGLSIRFAEEAMRNMGNLKVDSFPLYDDDDKKIVKYIVLELEGNTEWAKTITIPKTAERTRLKEGQIAIGQRRNSYGDMVFIVEATPDDVSKKEGAEASKAWRDGILKNIPADIKEECWNQATATTADQNAKDPAAAKKAVMDGFASIGVSPDRLKDYLGHELDTLSPAEVEDLRGIYTAIDEGEITWAAVIDAKAEARAAQAAEDAKRAAAGGPASAAKSVDEAVRAAKEKREAAKKAGAPAGQAAAAGTATAPAGAKAAAPAQAKADPGAVISPGPGKSPPVAATPAPAPATTTVPHNPQTGEVKPDFVMSTPKQRKALGEAIFGARLSDETVCGWFGAKELTDLSGPQIEDALDKIKEIDEHDEAVAERTDAPAVADLKAALAKAKLGEDVIQEWFGKPVEQLDEDERHEAARTIAEAS